MLTRFGFRQVAAVTVMLYDWILTLPGEVRLVWLAEWNYTKALFLLARYTTILNGYFILRGKYYHIMLNLGLNILLEQLFLDVNPEICKYTYPVASGE